MIIDSDTDNYGTMMILSELPPDSEDAIREVVGAFTDSVEMNWLQCLETEGVSSVDEIDQTQEMSLVVDLTGVDDPQSVIDSLEGLVLGTYEKTIELSNSSKTQLYVEVALSLEDVNEEDDDSLDDFDDESEPTTHHVARFRADFSIQ